MANSVDLFGMEEEESVYTAKTQIPQYLPKGECPSLSACYNIAKYEELISDINKADITEEQKEFLRFAATRHIVFRYDRIADYYAHQPKEMQELMGKSALVIIDFEDAIANGYVKLSKTIEKIREATGQEKHYDNL